MAIVTSKFRVSAASGFATTFTNENIYMVLGRPQSWDNSLSTNFASSISTTVNDANPPSPIDNYNNEYAFWRDAMAGVKINGNNVRLCVVRNNWQGGTRYDMYRHDISSFDQTITGKSDLSNSNFIVYNTSNGAVYKCLYNGKLGTNTGVTSTYLPTSTSTQAFTMPDGYIWKFLYQLTAADADFITANYIPVPSGTSSVSNVNGIDVILVTTSGGTYATAPSVTIYGDGTSATAHVTTSGSSGALTLTGIVVDNAGSGYTWAQVSIGGSGTAAAKAIIAPTGGHGANLATETMAHNVMIAGTVSGYDSNDFPVNQDFRTVALVKNPLSYSTTSVVATSSAVYTANTGRILRTLTMTSTATSAPTADTLLTGDPSFATGLFVFQSSGTVSLQYIQPVNSDAPDSITASRIDTTGTKNLKQFTSSDNITAVSPASYSQRVVGTSITPEIQPYSGQLLYLDYRQPVTRSAGQNEKINIVINF
jgi:hypothetical protein